ncbi:helix-turn-helix domain-containing protein [Scytonema sp. UIC 10036]|uniref:response regulator transcription factor n=1 Tax=Scytonema sp. UIC 10036 TaxID=2304196 RepID=UPI0012DAA29B|nr:DNA-binding response regulator [Scytonema sp. UIC 10036]MUH00673.1 helix-turn-helix domain-containing protein [Scytonema sp. UIC 10036]
MAKETVKKILVIENKAETRKLFLSCLKAEGFHAISAENGAIAVQRAQQELPDLIISEVLVPKLDGFRVLMALRQNPATAIIPFIFVTAKVSRTDIRKGMELGADDYITKPCTLDELLKAIAARLQRQAILQKLYGTVATSVTENPSGDSCGTSLTNAVTPTGKTSTGTFLYSNSKGIEVPSAKQNFSANSTMKSDDPQSILPNDPELKEVFRFIEANYNQQITLSDVAGAVGYSPAYLTNLVRRQTGQTVQGWIIERRMAAARSLLLETNERVDEIATRIGYYHTVHFFRQFRQYHGTTPQAWRRTQLAQYKTQYTQERKNG